MHTLRSIITGLAASLAISYCTAQDSGFGLGFILGEPTGLSMKGWVNGTQAIDGALAWSLVGSGSFHAHVDYLFHNYNLITVKKGRLPLYYGPGIRTRAWHRHGHRHGREWHYDHDHADLGVRFPVGLNYQFASAPIDVFLEVVPSMNVLPATYFDVDAGLGMRFWF